MSEFAPKPAKGRSRSVSPQLRLDFTEEQRVRREDNVQVRCRACGKRFSLPRWYAEMGVRLLFCGERCRKVWDGDRPHEPFHLTLRGRSRYRGGNWGIQAARARARDGYCCRVCGVTEEDLRRQLDVHHVVPVRMFGSASEANRLNNLISVCRPCHKREEEAGRADLPLFERVKHPGQRCETGDER